jgi:hypothetical protein
MKARLTKKSSVMRFEALHYSIFVLDLLGLFVTQSILSGFEPLAKTFGSSGFFFSLFAGLLAGFELGLQLIGMFFGTAECIWKENVKGRIIKMGICNMLRAAKLYLLKWRSRDRT